MRQLSINVYIVPTILLAFFATNYIDWLKKFSFIKFAKALSFCSLLVFAIISFCRLITSFCRLITSFCRLIISFCSFCRFLVFVLIYFCIVLVFIFIYFCILLILITFKLYTDWFFLSTFVKVSYSNHQILSSSINFKVIISCILTCNYSLLLLLKYSLSQFITIYSFSS